MEDELICYYGRWIRKSEFKYKTEATNNISNKYLYIDCKTYKKQEIKL